MTIIKFILFFLGVSIVFSGCAKINNALHVKISNEDGYYKENERIKIAFDRYGNIYPAFNKDTNLTIDEKSLIEQNITAPDLCTYFTYTEKSLYCSCNFYDLPTEFIDMQTEIFQEYDFCTPFRTINCGIRLSIFINLYSPRNGICSRR